MFCNLVEKMIPENQKHSLLVLCGPTAVGKTELALLVAERFSCEIVSVDSMQVYRYMNIGTAKPTTAERSRIPHYLIDIANPDENYTLGRFISDAETAVGTIHAHGKIPLLAGGTGLYFKGFLDGVFSEHRIIAERVKGEGRREIISVRHGLRRRLREEGRDSLHRELAELDPETAARIHPNDTQRLLRGLEIYYFTGTTWSQHLAGQVNKTSRYRTFKMGLTRPRKNLYERINQRVLDMVAQGLLAEVNNLLAMGYDKTLKSMQSIGYRHMINFIENKWRWEETLEFLARDTRHYAKRQYTWFNSDPEITWYDVNETDKILRAVEIFIAQK
jgi:tRNA dimethylallyltransferase